MTTLRKVVLLGSMVFAMGAVAGCGDDDDENNFDAPVTTVDARPADAASPSFDAARDAT